MSGHPCQSLSAEDQKEFWAKEKARKLAEMVIWGDERVWVSDTTFKKLSD
jgi:hypothetical protein